MADVNADFPNSAGSMGFLHRLLEIDRASELAEMIRGIAHELNQPLASMATFSQAGVRMLDRSDPLVGRSLDVFRQISQEALDAGARLQGLRRVFDQGAPQQHRCQMADLVKEVQPVLDNLTRVIKAQLQVDVPTGLPDICVDRLKIQRVLLALVRNAVDASSDLPAERVIRIDVLADRYSIEVGITDRGVGVSTEVQEKLFHPFFTSKAAGHGLGLASSQAIVESHGGTIGFNNIPSSGVRFWFKLPVASD